MRLRGLLEPPKGLAGSTVAITFPMLLMVGVFVAVAASSGGIFPTGWLPAALFGLAALATALLTISTSAAVPRSVAVAAGLLLAYAAWSYASILWADDPGLAVEGANRTFMYAIVFALFALWPLRGGLATVVIGALGLGIAGLALVTLLRLGVAPDASEFFVNGRFSEPVDYNNGNVALWFTGFFPCVMLAARREVPAPLRALALSGAGLLAGTALMTQSRGWAFTAPLALLLFMIVAPGRARNGVALVAVGAAVTVFAKPILAVFALSETAAIEPLAASGVRAILAVAGVLAAAGLLVALLDRSVTVGPRAARGVSAATVAVLIVVVLAGIGAGVAAVGDPVARASEAWAEFKTGTGTQPSGDVRFITVAGQSRYDFWRVALTQFVDEPLIGAGVDNFQDDYLVHGEGAERPRYPHSLELRIISQTGVVGALLFGGAIAVALVAGIGAAFRRSGLAGAAAGTAVATFLYWAVHGSVDWFFEIPALGAPAFAMLGLACGLVQRRDLAEPRRPASNSLAAGPIRLAGLAAVFIVGVAALGLPWLSALETQRAIEVWPADPDQAFARLDSAARLHPLSAEPHAVSAAIALELDRRDTAVEQFEAVLDVHPRSAYATLLLAALTSQEGDRRGALELLRTAGELAPREELVDQAFRSARAGRSLDATEIYRTVIEQRRALTD